MNHRRKSMLKNYKNRLQALVNRKIGFESNRKLLIQKVGFRFALRASVLSGVIESLIIKN